MVKLMDETGLGVISNMDGGFGEAFDQTLKIGEPYRDRIIHFARLNFEGVNQPGLVRQDRGGAGALLSRPARRA